MGLTVKNLDVHGTVHRLEQVAIDCACIELVGEFTGTTLIGELLEGLGFDDGETESLCSKESVPRFGRVPSLPMRGVDLVVV